VFSSNYSSPTFCLDMQLQARILRSYSSDLCAINAIFFAFTCDKIIMDIEQNSDGPELTVSLGHGQVSFSIPL
ncbi:MAG: hypothetical protein ACPG4F_12185, partial [Paracoccaceae bacterium]